MTFKRAIRPLERNEQIKLPYRQCQEERQRSDCVSKTLSFFCSVVQLIPF